MSTAKHSKKKIVMVLHSLPYNSTFLWNKFRLLSATMNVEMLVWDSQRNLGKLKIEDKKLRSRIHLGLYKTGFPVVLHLLYCIPVFLRYPVKLSQFFFFLKNRFGWIKGFGNVIKYYPLVSIQPDVVHFEFGTLGKEMMYLKAFFQFKTIVSFRGYDLNYVGLADPQYYDRVWSHADGFHFLGHDLRNRAIKRGYKKDKGIEVLIPPAIDIHFFKRSEVYPKINGKLILISVGRVVWKKGLEYSIRLVRRLIDAGYPVELRIIGTGDFMQAIHYTIFEHNLIDHVKLLGSKSSLEIKNELEQAHVFLHLAISEGFCNAVVEAQAMELPVVCSDADGLPENVEDEVTGFVVPKWELDKAEQRIKELYNSPDRAKQMGKKGRLRVERLFSLDDQINHFKEFYSKVCE